MFFSLVRIPWRGWMVLLLGSWMRLEVEGATADLSSLGQPVPAALRAMQVRARIAAEPDRVKEILQEHGSDWCGMAEQTRRRHPLRLMGFGACRTEGPPDLPANRDACIPEANTPFKTIRLKFNVFRLDDGSAAAATQAQVDAQVEELNAAYAASRIRFVHTTEYLNSTRFRSLSYFVNSEESDMKRTHADRPGQQHNIYVVDIEPDPERGGSLLGVSTFPWDASAVLEDGGTILDDDSIGAGQRTLVHELGHALGLWHTHHGVREVEECSSCWERADGANANATGDFCSDTPPTPVNYKCQAPGGNDPCSGRPWGATAPQNYMGYAPDSCYTEFTPQQAGRMHCWIQERLQGWLVTGEGATVTLAASDPNASEAGPDAGTFTITRTGATALALTVRFSRGGTATQGADYHALGETVTIPAGSASATVRVTPINDTEPEPAETVVLTLAAGAGYQIGNPATATVTLQDDDTANLPTVTVAASDASAAEAGTDLAVFTVARTGPNTAPLSVQYTVAGTASAPADFGPVLPGSIVIPAGSATATIQIVPVNDTVAEADETVILTIAAGTGYAVGNPGTATATIADDDSPVGPGLLAENFDTATAPVLPAGWTSEATGAGQRWQTVQFAGPTPPNIVFALSSEEVGDANLTSPAFNVPASGARLSFVHGYNLEEGFDGGVLEISVAGGPFSDVVAAGGAFEEGGYTGLISEVDGSPIAGRPAWTGDSVVNVRTVVRLPAGANGRSVRLRWRLATDAGTAEGGWGLDNVEAELLGGGGTSVSVAATDPEASEAGSNPGSFTVTRTGSTAAPLAVSVTVGGTASSGADYQAIPATLTLPAGSASVAVAVVPIDDSAVEPSETVVLNLSAGTGYVVGAPASATVTIRDNEGGGETGVIFSERFDGVNTPALPSGWSVEHAGGGVPWRTELYDGLTPPNVAFAPGPDDASDNALITPPIAIATAEARMTFEHGYSLEEGYDGGVLEISMAGGPFVDILAAGGAFLTAGYSGFISTTDGSLIAGRQAWTGDSVGNPKTEVRLPATAAGRSIRLRWRLVADGGIGGGGWGIDNVVITESTPAGGLPAVSLAASDGFAAEYGPDRAELTISRTGATAAALTVGIEVAGTATAGVDYEALTTTVTIPAGSSTAPLRIMPINDAALEGLEIIAVNLVGRPEYVLGAARAVEVALLDNGTRAPVVFGANFDDATAPGLPPGWSAQLIGAGTPWGSVSSSPLTPPNSVFAPDPDGVADNSLLSPPIPIATASAQLTFVHEYQLEDGYDGGVLEIALGTESTAVFRDILAAGGTFVSGGYDGPISTTDGSPIAGRNAWTGRSEGPQVTRVNLPAEAAGRLVRLRWRCASDAGVADVGWALDTVTITETGGGGGAADLAVSLQGTPSPVIAEQRLTYTIVVTNRTAVVAREVVVTNELPANVRFLGATSSQGAISGVGTVVARLGLLNGRASATISIEVVPTAAGTLNATARVAGLDPDPDPANNAAQLTTGVLPTATPAFVYTNAAGLNISEAAGPASVYPSAIVVSGFVGTVGRLAVNLHGLSHTFPDDLDIVLVGPGGQKVVLMSDAGGDQRFAITHATLTFEDDAPRTLPYRSEIASGTYRPTDFEPGETLPGPAPAGPYGTSLAVFNGTHPNGSWQLFVADDEARDGGRLAGGWSLSITRAAADTTPPAVTTHPQSQIVAAGASVTFEVGATGTAPLSYQWRLNGVDLPGATASRFNLAGVTTKDAGEYTVRVSNDGGVAVSRPATLTVTTQARRLRFADLSVTPGSRVSIPVILTAQGDENRVRFSVGFDPERLGFASVALGTGATGASVGLNVNQLESGRLGIQLSLPAGRTLTAGEATLALIEFEARGRDARVIPVTFLDAPFAREVVGLTGQPLPADYLPGTVTFLEGAPGPVLSGVVIGATGLPGFTIQGEVGASYRVESSTDLRAWTEREVVATPTGTATYTDPTGSAGGARFYRARRLP